MRKAAGPAPDPATPDAAIEALKAQKGVDGGRIAVIGFCFGHGTEPLAYVRLEGEEQEEGALDAATRAELRASADFLARNGAQVALEHPGYVQERVATTLPTPHAIGSYAPYKMLMVSATQAGRSSPSISIVHSLIICRPPALGWHETIF